MSMTICQLRAQTSIDDMDDIEGIVLGYNIGNYDAKLISGRTYKITKMAGKDFNHKNSIRTNLAGNIISITIEAEALRNDWLGFVQVFKDKYSDSFVPPFSTHYGQNAICTAWIGEEKTLIMTYPPKGTEGPGIIEFRYLQAK